MAVLFLRGYPSMISRPQKESCKGLKVGLHLAEEDLHSVPN